MAQSGSPIRAVVPTVLTLRTECAGGADWCVDTASAYAATEDYPQAIAAARRAVALEPDDLSRVQVLVSLQLQAGQAAAAVASLQDYTARNPEDAEICENCGHSLG